MTSSRSENDIDFNKFILSCRIILALIMLLIILICLLKKDNIVTNKEKNILDLFKNLVQAFQSSSPKGSSIDLI